MKSTGGVPNILSFRKVSLNGHYPTMIPKLMEFQVSPLLEIQTFLPNEEREYLLRNKGKG